MDTRVSTQGNKSIQGNKSTQGNKSIWFTQRAILAHLTVVIVAPGCLVAAWWQANRALSGNLPSYIYSVEWPIFSIYAVYLWWKIVHEVPGVPANAPETPGTPETPETPETPGTPEALEASTNAPGVPTNNKNETRYPVIGRDKIRIFEDDDDLERAAYNNYLKELARSGKNKTWKR